MIASQLTRVAHDRLDLFVQGVGAPDCSGAVGIVDHGEKREHPAQLASSPCVTIYRANHLSVISFGVPALPLRERKESPWWPKLHNRCDRKCIFSAFVSSSRNSTIFALCHHALSAHTPTAHSTTIS